MGVDYLQHVVQADTEAATGFPGILFVLCSTLKAVEDGFQLAFGTFHRFLPSIQN